MMRMMLIMMMRMMMTMSRQCSPHWRPYCPTGRKKPPTPGSAPLMLVHFVIIVIIIIIIIIIIINIITIIVIEHSKPIK